MVFEREQGGTRPTSDADLVVDVVDVMGDGLGGDAKFARDRLVARSGRHKLENFDLAVGEALGPFDRR